MTEATLDKTTDDAFSADVLDSDKPVLVDFWAEWCHPCHMVEPHVKAIAQEQSDKLKVVKFNIDENPQVTQRYQVFSIPTLILFADGEEKRRIVGAQAKQRILSEIASFI